MSEIDIVQSFTEFLGMSLFVFVGCGAATASYVVENTVNSFADSLTVAMAFGLAITVVAYGTAHYGSAQLNPAVTFGLGLSGNLTWSQAVVNILSQMLGAILGVAFVLGMTNTIPPAQNALGTNAINYAGGVTVGNAFLGEVVSTYLLVFTVFQTAVSKRSGANKSHTADHYDMTLAPLPIGFAVLCAHIIMIPIDGCSINPARTFGASVVAAANGFPNAFQDQWVFWVAPVLGSLLASLTWMYIYAPDEAHMKQAKKEDIEMDEARAEDFVSPAK